MCVSSFAESFVMIRLHLFRLNSLKSQRPIRSWLLPVVLLSLAFTPTGLLAQAPAAANAPSTARNSGMHRPDFTATGYLAGGQLNFLSILPPPPALDSEEDRMDVATLRAWQQTADSARWRLAEEDANLSYSRFSAVLGEPIDAASSPLLVHLLDRVEADITSELNGAKRYYNRPRPYQRFPFEHVCEFAKPPAPDMTKGGNSYPSGHSAFGWAVALTLAQVAPDKSQEVLARSREYGESRIVCVAHYPSDVHASEILVSVAFGQIETRPEFRRDLSCAQQEYASANHSSSRMDSECLVLKNQLFNDK